MMSMILCSGSAVGASVMSSPSHKDAYNRMAKAVNPYGDGTACKKIVSIIGSLA
jgi:UDP-N-acetylglucosamine 2-epimerase